MLLKLKKYGGSLHFHSSDYHLVLLQGTMRHWAEGEQRRVRSRWVPEVSGSNPAIRRMATLV
jgi:hypothetical protein